MLARAQELSDSSVDYNRLAILQCHFAAFVFLKTLMSDQGHPRATGENSHQEDFSVGEFCFGTKEQDF